MTSTPPLDRDAIQARLDAATEGPWMTTQDTGTHVVYVNSTSPKGQTYSSVLWNADWATEADAEFIAHAPADVAALLAEVHRLRARLWEHERPATEAERNALRQSFTELVAQASEDGDHEGAFSLECQLREREEQWAREDAAVLPSSGA